jgi:hypothetical protein
MTRRREPTEALEELAGMVAEGKVDPTRTAAYLEGEREVPTSMRLPARLLARVDALAPFLEGHPAFASRVSSRVSRSAVLRAALERGLDALEADPGKGPPKRAEVRAALDVITRWAEHLEVVEDGEPEGGPNG